jgi:SAM-dependent methyltransferase
MDVSSEALQYAAQHYSMPNIRFLQASCSQLPLAAGSCDLVVAFEVIEHLQDWRGFLEESRRILAPGGQCVISTPNKGYYTDSRGETGANPYHAHEFTFQEFRDELRAVFPHVSLFLQNHAEGFVFQPVKIFTPAEARVESGAGSPEVSHFFVAVCALAPQTGAPTFLFLPRAANILREREQHIERLSERVAALTGERDSILEMFRGQTDELEERNRWAKQLDTKIEEAGTLVRQLQSELKTKTEGYEAKIAELEAALVERTNWALGLDRQVRDLETKLDLLRSSRWVRFGKALGVGPRLPRD